MILKVSSFTNLIHEVQNLLLCHENDFKSLFRVLVFFPENPYYAQKIILKVSF